MTPSPLRAGANDWLIAVATRPGPAATARAQSLAASLRALAGVAEAVPGLTSVLVSLEPGVGLPPSEDQVAEALSHAHRQRGQFHEIPIVYDGEDLPALAHELGLSPAEIARLHAGRICHALAAGFAPGFTFLGPVDPRLRIARRDSPRARVTAGSVGLAAGLTGIYPAATPGGWHLIGRTNIHLFDPTAEPPCLIQPGDRVRFRECSDLPAPPPVAAAGPPAVTGRGLLIIATSPGTTVQAEPRRLRAFGIPAAGPCDVPSATLAAAACGHGLRQGVFEITAGTFRARPTAAMTLAAAGPGVDLRLDGRAVAVGAAHHVESGVTVEVRVRPPGLRAYLAAGGGIDVPLVQGSRSTDTLAWFGGFAGRALAPGDRVPVAATAPSSVSVPPPPVTEVTRGETRVLDAIAGPQTGSLTRAGIRALASEFTVTPQADRTGVRLSGPPVPMRAAQMVSEPLAVGAVQVTPAGELVVLLANHQTHGGYPKPLVVLRPETVAQLRPGTRVRFRILD